MVKKERSPDIKLDKNLIVLYFTIVACVIIAFYFSFFVYKAEVYTHFFYIPILLAGMWYYRKAVYVAWVLGVVHVLLTHFSTIPLSTDVFGRVVIFSVVAYVIGYVSEQRVKGEDTLRESEERYRTFIDSTSDMVFLKDNQFKHVIANKALSEFSGKREDEIIGMTDFELLPESAAEQCRQSDTKAMELGTVVITEEQVSDRIYETLKFPVRLGDKRIGVGGYIRDITERKDAEKHINRLNSVLKAIRSVNKMIMVEKDRDSLLQKACDALVEARGYDAAWLGFLQDGQTFAMVKGSGFGEDVARFSEHVVSGDHPPCVRNALAQKEKLVIVDKSRVCGDCFFKSACVGKEAAIIRVERADMLFGLLAVVFAPNVTADEEEKELLKEVAGDMALALHNKEMEEARKRAEEALKQTALLLQEHVEKLEEAKRLVEEACSLREHFLKETSHRIITPVAIIGGCAQLLLDSRNLDEDQKKKIRIMQARNAEVQKLVRDALAGKYLEEEAEEGGGG